MKTGKIREYLLIRHGETEHNRDNRFLGSTDVGLNDRGRRQAAMLGDMIRDEGVGALYSSDLSRCRETVETMNLRCQAEYSERLREMDFGRWEGLSYAEIKKGFREEMSRWKRDWIHEPAPGGESFDDMCRRVIDFFNEIRKGDSEKTVIVSHGGCIRAILGVHIMGNPAESWRFFIDNGTVTRLCFDRDFAYLKSLNEKMRE